MESHVGTISIGVRAPVIRAGDMLPRIVADSVFQASRELGMKVETGDVIAVTESVVARAEGNYVKVDDIAREIREKYGESKIAVVHPILSRNRFSMILKGICRGAQKGGVLLVLSLPTDEVGNRLISDEEYQATKMNFLPVISEKTLRKEVKSLKHLFTGIDYVEYYKEIAQSENCNMKVVFANNPEKVMFETHSFLCCDIHTREVTKQLLRHQGASRVFGLDDICSTPNRYTGYNAKFGLLGSNKATEEKLKLLPREPEYLVSTLQYLIYDKTGKSVEILVYGDGAFKDPVGHIWELADPVVGIAYSPKLKGRPNEMKLKALADDEFGSLDGEELQKAVREKIKSKPQDLVGSMSSQGTTPRQLTDLIGSLADLTSGSGDKGTPIVWIKNYFKNYADE